jgi:hypothetical protein
LEYCSVQQSAQIVRAEPRVSKDSSDSDLLELAVKGNYERQAATRFP